MHVSMHMYILYVRLTCKYLASRKTFADDHTYHSHISIGHVVIGAQYLRIIYCTLTSTEENNGLLYIFILITSYTPVEMEG